MNEKHEGLDQDRLGVLAGAMLLTLGLTRLLALPARPVTLGGALGISIQFQLSVTTIMALLMLGLSLTGMESLVRSHPAARAGRLGRSLIHWVLPGLLGIALVIWLGRLDNLGVWTLALLASMVPLPLTLAVEYAAVDLQPTQRVWVQWGLMALAHVTALLLFYVTFDSAGHWVVQAAAVIVTAGLLAFRLFWTQVTVWRQAARLGALVGLMLGLLALLSGFLPLSSLRAGLLLLLGFYVAVGLIGQYLAGRFGQALLIEYGAVTVVGLAALVLLVP